MASVFVLQFTRSKDEFFLLREKTDAEAYQVKLLSCFLYVPVAQLSSTAFSEIERVLTSKSVAIHYRKIEIRNLNLVAGKEEYNSDNLFTTDCPCRIVICFIESKNKTGSFDLNPFDFQRSWQVTTGVTSTNDQLSEKERYLEKKLLDFEKQLSYFKSCVNLVTVDETSENTQSKGKGRGKKSKPTESPIPSTSLFNRLRSSFSAPQDSQSEHSEGQSEAEASTSSTQPPTYLEATTKTIYIKQVQLLLNGTPLDQIECRETSKFNLNLIWVFAPRQISPRLVWYCFYQSRVSRGGHLNGNYKALA